MPTFTAFLNLIKPAGSEVIDVSQINDNSDDIDTFASGTDSRLDVLEALLDLANAGESTSPPAGFTLAAGWTLSDWHGYRIGRLRVLQINVVRTGATLTGNASGNITDASVYSAVPSDWQPPAGSNTTGIFQVGGSSFGNFALGSSIVLQTLHATGTIASTDSVRLTCTYYV